MMRFGALPILLTLAMAWPGFAAPPPAHGTLVIAGGGPLPTSVFAAFVQAAGGRGATVAIVPVASGDPEGSVAALQGPLTTLGARVQVLRLSQRTDASRSDLLSTAAACSGYWFTGGDQNRIGDLVVDTPLHEAIVRRYRAGAVVGGTSAGAAAMSRIMLTGDGDPGETAPGSFRTRHGLGLLGDCIVDQHFLRRTRHNRLLSLLLEHPDHLGLGVDEETALIVQHGQATVVGNRRVLVIDPRSAAVGQGTATDLRVHLMGPGQQLDLASGRILNGGTEQRTPGGKRAA